MLKMIAVILLLTSLVFVAEAKNKCEKGWEHFGYSCYYFSQNALTWEKASVCIRNCIEIADICNDHDAHLVRVNNKEELQYLLKKVKAISHAHYTDATDSCKEGKWIWDSTGEMVKHAGWHKGEPNNAHNNEDCMVIMSSSSNDVSCSHKYRYICEKLEKSFCWNSMRGFGFYPIIHDLSDVKPRPL